jgi:hypothetical protein
LGSTTLITITPANIITIALLGLLGYGILVGASMAYSRLTGSTIGASS